MTHNKPIKYSKAQLIGMVSLRVLIGWYFLYEGVVKLFSANWTSFPYLMDSKGWFAAFFIHLAETPTLLSVVDFINVYGLILVGLSLILGCFAPLGKIAAALFLIMFYLSHPPIIHATYLLPPEGSYLWVDKNLIMLSAVAVLILFPTSQIIGFDRYIKRYRQRKK